MEDGAFISFPITLAAFQVGGCSGGGGTMGLGAVLEEEMTLLTLMRLPGNILVHTTKL